MVLAAVLLAGASSVAGAAAAVYTSPSFSSPPSEGLSFALTSDNSSSGGLSFSVKEIVSGIRNVLSPTTTPDDDGRLELVGAAGLLAEPTALRPQTGGGAPPVTESAPAGGSSPSPTNSPSGGSGASSAPVTNTGAGSLPAPPPAIPPSSGGSPPSTASPPSARPAPPAGSPPQGSAPAPPATQPPAGPSSPTTSPSGGRSSSPAVAPGAEASDPVQGTVTVRLTDANETKLASVAASVTALSMAPGDAVTGFLEVSNAGSLAQRYTVLTTDTTAAGAANTALSAVLTAGIDARAPGSACSPTQGGAGQAIVKPAGTLLQTLAIAARDLGAGVSERLCFYVTLPLSAGNSSQGGAASFTLTFVAEQA